jgi:two-component system, NtrC family, response regulator PilR
MKALIAFSDSEIMISLCEALAETNVELELCSNISELCAALTQSRVDIIFCQPRLPDGTFRNLLRFVESSGLDPAVIVCAAVYDKTTYLDAMTLGAFDYVALPFQKTAMDWIVGNAAHRLPHPPPQTRAQAA